MYTLAHARLCVLLRQNPRRNEDRVPAAHSPGGALPLRRLGTGLNLAAVRKTLHTSQSVPHDGCVFYYLYTGSDRQADRQTDVSVILGLRAAQFAPWFSGVTALAIPRAPASAALSRTRAGEPCASRAPRPMSVQASKVRIVLRGVKPPARVQSRVGRKRSCTTPTPVGLKALAPARCAISGPASSA